MDDGFYKNLAKRFRDDAETVERIGDNVGSNDYELSNLLWRSASKLRKYAETLEKRQ